MLFIRGKAISGALIISGTSQFPNPPIIIGITIKKIIKNAWEVTETLNACSLIVPGDLRAIRMIKLKEEPSIAAHKPRIK